MRIGYKLSFLKFVIMGIAILVAFPLTAQRKTLSSSEVSHAERKLPSLSANVNKVSLLLDISNWYYDVHTPEVQDFSKASKFAMEALVTSKAIGYQKGIGSSYLQLSKINQEIKNYIQGRTYAMKAVNALKQEGDHDLLGESWVMLWSTSTLTGASYDIRVSLLKNARVAFNLSGNIIREGDCLRELGDIYQINGDYAEAIIVLEKTLVLYKKAGFKRPETYDLIGRVYLLMGNLDKGIKDILEAEKIADEFGETSVFTSTLNNSIAMAYNKFGQPEKALPYIEKSLQIAVKYNDFDKIVVVLVNHVGILIRLKKTKEALELLNTMTVMYPALKNQKNPMWDTMMADIYISRKEFGKAAYYCDGIEKKIKKHGAELDKDYIFGFISSIIRYNIATRHYDKASYYNAKYDSLCGLRNRIFCNTDYSLWEFKIDSAAGNYLSAIKHFQRYKEINDEIFSEAKTTQINQLSILHESEKKDKNILLLQQRAVSQQSMLESANFVRNTTLLGLLVMSVFIFIMYKNYSLKQKTNIALKAQKEEINLKNESLQYLVSEKEWLLKEIHHRVKNNLHMVVGLLASQGEYLKGKEAVQAIGESQRRVEAMSIIHQKLYQSENLSMIDMPSYIYELTENLADSFEKGRQIRFQLDICDVEFPLSHSVPVGLILNEAITNAIKYAFPDGAIGTIEIVLKREGAKGFYLKIRDNGVGIGEHFNIEECSSLGLRLIQGLAGDMQGDFRIANNSGTEIELRFTIHEDRGPDLKII